jgi:uncharacterized protein (DUF362 family)
MLSRREFLRRSLLYTLASMTGSSALASCAKPPETPTPVPPTATAIPTSTLAPTATRLLPTATIPATAAPTVIIPTATTLPTATMTATPVPPTTFEPYLAVARGANPAAITRAAIDTLGGISRFVKKGNDVIIKPNICNASMGPELATTTNPAVVAELVKLCLEAGAARVRVMDQPFAGTAVEAYKKSGIREAVEKAGGQMELMVAAKYADIAFPNGRDIKKWKVYQDILKADVVINVPIAKTHSLAKYTLAMKGLMGVITDCERIHNAMDQRLADLASLIKPTLNVVDGVRVLVKNGPTTWDPNDNVVMNTIIASHDIVAADAYAIQALFKTSPSDVGYIKICADMGIGRYDFDKLRIKEVTA